MLSNTIDSMVILFTIYIKDKTISQIYRFEQNNLDICSTWNIFTDFYEHSSQQQY